MTESDCSKQTNCLWCEGAMLALNQCATSDMAKQLTGPLYTCRVPVESNIVVPVESNIVVPAVKEKCFVMTESDCSKQTNCLWCEGAMLALNQCATSDMAKQLTGPLYTCRVPVESNIVVPAVKEKCFAITESDCSKQTNCLWCEGAMLALNQCATSDMAKQLTGPLYTCRVPETTPSLPILKPGPGFLQSHISNSVDCALPQENCNMTVGCAWCNAAKGYAVRNGCLTLGDAMNVNQNILVCELPPIFMPGPVMPKNTTEDDVVSAPVASEESLPIKKVIRPVLPVVNSPVVSTCSARTESDCAAQGSACMWCRNTMYVLTRCATAEFAKQYGKPNVGYSCVTPLSTASIAV